MLVAADLTSQGCSAPLPPVSTLMSLRPVHHPGSPRHSRLLQAPDCQSPHSSPATPL